MYFNLQDSDIVFIAIFYCVVSTVIYLKLRKPVSDSVDSMGKIKQVMSLMVWLLFFSGFVVVSGGFLAHQDTAWHQVTLIPDELIPGRMIIYSIFYPLYLIVGGSIWFYAQTRLAADDFDLKFKIALVCTAVAPFMFLPSQDSSVMILSADLWNIIFRSSYWAMMAIWISSLLYLVGRLGLMVVTLSKGEQKI
ncbi:MAG: methane monooxygenase/ammonia monooxygenase subunit C [Cycloclasticus sp.]